jgi:DNA-directed RNA polymerase I subunit RPA43
MSSDSDPSIAPGRKRKHKDKHPSPSKKRKRKHGGETEIDLIATDAVPKSPKKSKKSKSRQKHGSEPAASISTDSESNSPFNLVTSTMYLPLSPISISPTHALASLLAEHLSPLLLTYYPPFKGVVLAYSDASISSTPPLQPVIEKDPQPLTLAITANEYGVLFVYLTATFLVFRPRRGQILEGWVNVQSDGFLGVVVYNLFSVSIERRRLPTDWEWIHPKGEDEGRGKEGKRRRFAKGSSAAVSATLNLGFDPEKEHFTPLSKPLTDGLADYLDQEQDWDSSAMGYFQSISGHRVHGTIKFRVRDVDVIPGAETDRWFLSIEGTMLTPEEETRLVAEERKGVYSTARRDNSVMSEALAPPSSQPIDGDGDGEVEQVDEGIDNSVTKSRKEKSKREEEPKEKTKEKKSKRKEERSDKKAKEKPSTSKSKSRHKDQ